MASFKLAPLSTYPTSQAWLAQFDQSEADRTAAEAMLDTMLLLNEEQVSAAIRSQLYRFADGRRGRHRRVALYAEREFPQKEFFQSETIIDPRGRAHRRAVGRVGPPAVKPVRGGMRVGSEGLVALAVSTVVETQPEIFLNHPGPDRIRGKTAPVGAIVIVTDFIGSGQRVRDILDAMWAVPTVKAWRSRRLVTFHVVAAAGTAAGMTRVRRHRLQPNVMAEHIAPSLGGTGWRQEWDWHDLVSKYGPESGRGASRWGFGNSGALIAFSYRLPNNTPALLHKSEGGWRALYIGAAPNDLRPAFGLRSDEEAVAAAASATGVALSPALSPADATTVLLLSILRGRWRPGKEVALAERTGLPVPTVMEVLRRALRNGLLRGDGRLTDAGYAMVEAGRRSERERPTIPTAAEPYYPMQLRAPRLLFSARRSSERP
ncbi:phosphoribosyltransferase-like protein [Phenylobacterium sp.]|uniref:phosphoribosyltransferase-like protein n=1 Tax=Phenylobacterium sp. TaxID=1871053 RepID=UPI002FCAC326